MSDIQNLIKMLQSNNANKRYDACEELRVSRQPLPQEAIDALRSKINDPNSDVADAARRALALHADTTTSSNDTSGVFGDIKAALSANVEKLKSGQKSHPRAGDFINVCDKLLADDVMEFVVNTLKDNAPNAVKAKKSFDTEKLFTPASLFVAVTIHPWASLDEVRSHLRSGYSTLLIGMATKLAVFDSGKQQLVSMGVDDVGSWTHLAHWVYCTDGKETNSFLSLIPEAVNQKRTMPMIIAEELLTSNERKQMGL